jgi:hypothetical protein
MRPLILALALLMPPLAMALAVAAAPTLIIVEILKQIKGV